MWRLGYGVCMEVWYMYGDHTISPYACFKYTQLTSKILEMFLRCDVHTYSSLQITGNVSSLTVQRKVVSDFQRECLEFFSQFEKRSHATLARIGYSYTGRRREWCRKSRSSQLLYSTTRRNMRRTFKHLDEHLQGRRSKNALEN